jgi:hypothetical protein
MPIPAQNTKTIYTYVAPAVVPFVITTFIFDSQSKFSVSLNNINIVSTITSDANLNKVIFTPPLSIPNDSILVVSLNTPISRVDFIDPSNIDKVAINSQLNQFTLLIQQVNTNLKNIIHYQEDIVPPRDDLTFPSLDNNKIFYKNNSGVIVRLCRKCDSNNRKKQIL